MSYLQRPIGQAYPSWLCQVAPGCSLRGACLISLLSALPLLIGGGPVTVYTAQQAEGADLLRAASEGRVDDVRALLDHGLDVNWRNEAGWTPLLCAAQGGHPEVVALLLERGADFEAVNEAGWTPLIAASLGGRSEVVALLLERGANPHARSMSTPDGDSAYTALIVAAAYGHVGVINLLLDAGADVRARSRNGLTPLEAAAGGGHSEVVALLARRGADVNATVREGGTTLLMLAAAAGRTDLVTLLLDHGADPNAQDEQGITPLLAAEAAGHAEVVALLLESGATAGRPDSEPATADPEVRDQARAGQIISSHWPAPLLVAGIGGTVYLWLRVESDGSVENAQVMISSGQPLLDEAALGAVREIEFYPARRNGEAVAAWLLFPVTFGGIEPSTTTPPEVRDPTSISEIVSRYYPLRLWEAGIGGRVYLELYIDERGRVQRATVSRSSGYGELDMAALRAVREVVFNPALRDGVPVASSMTLAIEFWRR